MAASYLVSELQLYISHYKTKDSGHGVPANLTVFASTKLYCLVT